MSASNCSECPNQSLFGKAVGIVVALVAALAALSVAAIPYDFGESVCGVWGCFPPIQALVAMHLFWTVLFAAGVWIARGARPTLIRFFGFSMATVAFVTAVIAIGQDLTLWFDSVPEDYHGYWPRRIVYALATSTDRPFVQVIAAGAAAFVLGSRTRIQPGCPVGIRGDSIVPQTQENP